MRTATSRDRGAYDMPYAAMGYAGSRRRAMAPGSSNPCQPRTPTPRLTHALPPLVRGGDGGWRRACNVLRCVVLEGSDRSDRMRGEARGAR